jgi:hypothetical protein
MPALRKRGSVSMAFDPYGSPSPRRFIDMLNAGSSPASQVVNRILPSVMRNVGSQLGGSIGALLSDAFSQTATSSDTITAPSRRVRSRSAYLAGKVRPNKRVSRKLSYRKKRGKGKGKKVKTQLGLTVSGIHSLEEHRFVSKQDMGVGSRYEAVQVGHTSLPQRPVLLAMCRALLKFCLKPAFKITEFSTLLVDISQGTGSAFRVNDNFRWSYYPNWNSNALTFFNITVTATDTFESIARKLYYEFIGLAANGNINSIRWKQFEYDPEDTAVGNQYQWYVVQLNSLTVHLQTKSSMKVQNRTVNIVGVEDDADDVDNVPINGYLYNCKGNNFLSKTQRTILKGIDTSGVLGGGVNTANNDVILFEGSSKATPVYATGDAIFTAGGAEQQTFTKPAEPPKPFQIVNCKKSSKIRINPGGIKTSIVTSKTKTGFSYMLGVLCGDNNGSAQDKMKYSAQAGYCNVMHLEKVIGSNASPVAIAAEVQLDIWCAVTSKPVNTSTNSIQMMVDYGIVA